MENPQSNVFCYNCNQASDDLKHGFCSECQGLRPCHPCFEDASRSFAEGIPADIKCWYPQSHITLLTSDGWRFWVCPIHYHLCTDLTDAPECELSYKKSAVWLLNEATSILARREQVEEEDHGNGDFIITSFEEASTSSLERIVHICEQQLPHSRSEPIACYGIQCISCQVPLTRDSLCFEVADMNGFAELSPEAQLLIRQKIGFRNPERCRCWNWPYANSLDCWPLRFEHNWFIFEEESYLCAGCQGQHPDNQQKAARPLDYDPDYVIDPDCH